MLKFTDKIYLWWFCPGCARTYRMEDKKRLMKPVCCNCKGSKRGPFKLRRMKLVRSKNLKPGDRVLGLHDDLLHTVTAIHSTGLPSFPEVMFYLDNKDRRRCPVDRLSAIIPAHLNVPPAPPGYKPSRTYSG
jgi:hypothetical protein